jgi:hypothetical protein
MDHFDFTSDALIAGPGAMAGYWAPATPARAASARVIERYLGVFFAAVLAHDETARAFLARPPEQSVPGRPMTLEHRAGAPASITYEEVVAAVVAGRADEAIRELRALGTAEPNHFMLQENNLNRLCVSLLFTWGLGRETVPLVEFMLERFPSPGTQRLLAEAHILAEDYPAAIEILSRFVEQYPNAVGARAQLEALRSR